MTSNDIEPLINPEIALSNYDKIFTARTGYEIYFMPQIQKKGIIFPVWFTLQGDYLEAFKTTVTHIGETAFYVSLTERMLVHYKARPGYEKEFSEAARTDKDLSDLPFVITESSLINDWLYPLDMISTMAIVDGQDKPYRILDNAIYSINGAWGLWFSNDGYGIIGGSEDFIDTFYGAVGKTIDEVVLNWIISGDIFNKKYLFEKHLPRLFNAKQAEMYQKIYESTLKKE